MTLKSLCQNPGAQSVKQHCDVLVSLMPCWELKEGRDVANNTDQAISDSDRILSSTLGVSFWGQPCFFPSSTCFSRSGHAKEWVKYSSPVLRKSRFEHVPLCILPDKELAI